MANDKYKIEVNGVDITDAVEIDSYQTAYNPVYGETITTMDGVDHVVLLRRRGSVSFALNPQTEKMTERICSAFENLPAYVHYHCLQRHADVYANMRLDGLSAQSLGRIKFGGAKWVDLGSITLQEL
ncbi:MAG: hypothetical protein MSS60_00095 [Clostridiales bacterium]|nr:hypothetical protein [Clostridiales bacterium]